jgi:histidinol-phosphate/aromatic aminotransferase/cobyric acid decarboxylase-like protein
VKRFLDYYRQFEELPPDELSRQLRDQADERRARALAQVDPLDLTATTWHEPPHPETVNAATFALRRALNNHPDPESRALREALAARHGVEPDRVVVGHGAGELLRSACHALLAGGGELLVAWPGWHALPRLAERAGGRPVPVALGADGAPDLAALEAAVTPATRAIALCSPNDPTGAALATDELREFLAHLPERVTVLLDEALAEFREPGEDAVGLLGEAPNLLIVRSFSKAHALAGLRAGYALSGARDWSELAPTQGISAPAQAAALWAAESGEGVVARRREAAARARERLAAALAHAPVTITPGWAPFAWIAAEDLGARELAARLAAAKVYVAPGAAWGDEGHIRAALRGPDAVDRLADALRSSLR